MGELLYAKGDFQKSVVVNISDSLKISFDAENFTSSNNSHGWLDANGWVTKQCFIISNNTIYPAFLRIARTADLRNILYAVNINIKEGVKVDKTSPKSAVKSVTPSDAKSNTSDIKSQEKLYKKASMTESGIDYLIADSGAGTRTDYAQSWITSINPTDFLNLTLSEKAQNRNVFDKIKGDYGTNVNEYDYIEGLKKETRQTPYLAINVDTGDVVGHEGRHRMRALEKEGITSAEIKIEFRDSDGYLVKQKNVEKSKRKNRLNPLFKRFSSGPSDRT